MTVLNKEMKENRRVELTIRVERQEWQQALDDAYQANRDLYPVDGCAPGKATRQALEQAYAPDVFYQEAVNATFPRALVEAFGREEILVAGAPELRIVDIGPEGFTFAALAELYPEVKLGQYKGLSAPCPRRSCPTTTWTRPWRSGSRPTWWSRSGTGPPWATR